MDFLSYTQSSFQNPEDHLIKPHPNEENTGEAKLSAISAIHKQLFLIIVVQDIIFILFGFTRDLQNKAVHRK